MNYGFNMRLVRAYFFLRSCELDVPILTAEVDQSIGGREYSISDSQARLMSFFECELRLDKSPKDS